MRTNQRGPRRDRTGSSALEYQVAFTVFALALAGVFPMAAAQFKLTSRLDATMPPYTPGSDGTTFFLIPPSCDWNARCGPASVQTALPVPPPKTRDDADSSTALQSPAMKGWQTNSSSTAYGGSYRRHDASPTGEGSITWSFPASQPDGTGLPPGIYAVYVTWPTVPDLASNAPIQVLGAEPIDGGTDEPALNQQGGPRPDLTDSDNRIWQRLQHLYRTSDGSLQVRLKTDRSSPIAADAVRMVPAPRDVQLLSIQANSDGSLVLRVQVK